jgi:hypothetical protein
MISESSASALSQQSNIHSSGNFQLLELLREIRLGDRVHHAELIASDSLQRSFNPDQGAGFRHTDCQPRNSSPP